MSWLQFPDVPGPLGLGQKSYWLCGDCAVQQYEAIFQNFGDSYTADDVATPEAAVARADAINEQEGIKDGDLYRPTLFADAPAWAHCDDCAKVPA